MRRAKVEVIVALGSNLGDPVAQVRTALNWLAACALGPVRCSSLWQTTPVDCPPGSPLFVNAVAFFAPPVGGTPELLLAKMQALEREFGRQPKRILNEVRPLDLDLIAWGDERWNTPSLVLPHPRAHLRRFVLAPLAEIAPDFVLPGQARTAAEMLARLPPDPAFRRLG